MTDSDTEPIPLRFDDPTESPEKAPPNWVLIALLLGALGLTAVLATVMVNGVGTSAPNAGTTHIVTETQTVTQTVTATVVASSTGPSAEPPTPTPELPNAPSVAEVPDAPTDAPVVVYYKNCGQARAAGAAPLDAGEPGYRPELDPDGDGVACE